MKGAQAARGEGKNALELVEEASTLLRRAPLECLALYYLGTLPFVIGALYFWADMSRNADAGERLAGASLGLALLFLWMKFWQARFCAALSGTLLQEAVATPLPATVMTQAILQPWSLVVLPAALLATLPFGWCFAFFQNITVMGGGGMPDVVKRARRQAALWPGQNHVLLFIFLLLGLIVFANLCVGAFFLPRVLKTVLGVDSVFTRSHYFLLNSTFLASVAGLTYLCVDPLVKAVYLLRCYYGEALTSGADLLADLREAIRRSAEAGVTLMLLAALLLGPLPALRASAQAAGGTLAAQPIPAAQLDRSIKQVITAPEFAWRLPRGEEHRAEPPRFLRSALDLLKKWSNYAVDGFKRFLKWLSGFLPQPRAEEVKAKGGGFSGLVYPVMYGLIAILLSAAAVFFWRLARNRRQPVPVEPALDTVTMVPDLRDEEVTADQLTEDRWSLLAKELLGKGELRLGLRALYLASLACLADRRLIAIARFKSNHDYQRELGRFHHALPEVVASFASNVALFELTWYGMHKVEQGTLEAFLENHERIVSGVQQS